MVRQGAVDRIDTTGSSNGIGFADDIEQVIDEVGVRAVTASHPVSASTTIEGVVAGIAVEMVVCAAAREGVVTRAGIDDDASDTRPGQHVGRGIARQAGEFIAVCIEPLEVSTFTCPVLAGGLPDNHITTIGQSGHPRDDLVAHYRRIDTGFRTDRSAAGIQTLGEDTGSITRTVTHPGDQVATIEHGRNMRLRLITGDSRVDPGLHTHLGAGGVIELGKYVYLARAVDGFRVRLPDDQVIAVGLHRDHMLGLGIH
ncbi:hypothetical protein D3C81_1058870 [compost metagenome]